MAFRVPATLKEFVAEFGMVTRTGRMGYTRTYDEFFFKQVSAERKRRKLLRKQKFNYEEHQDLGSDLAAAKFVIFFCRGSILDHKDQWISRPSQLPPDYSRAFKLKGIKANNGLLLTEGLDNFTGLNDLEYLDLSRNPKLDDFACDQLSRQFRFSSNLREVDLSFNPCISTSGLEVLLKIKSLRVIKAFGTLASSDNDIDHFVLAAEHERNCTVGCKSVSTDPDDR